ncbi:hypothetical protein EHW64_13705 [Erwinia psidii]|uniref:hypothetical protein n=1 Tax=Erwinia psidii TaxID=69224 RepID=UPI00226BAB53|nr:hypothetical protein [Erwinia psidii]MCX8962158.1 hypothetical protein [Erwinia psidii]
METGKKRLKTMVAKNPWAEHIILARGQMRRLENAERNMLDMSGAWADLDSAVLAELEQLAARVARVRGLLMELTEECRRGPE